LDFSLVSNKNFSEILPSNGLGLGLDEVGQRKWPKSTPLMTSLTKNLKYFKPY